MRFVTRCEGRELRYSTLRLACRELNAPPNVYANVEIELEGRGIFYKNGLGFLKNQIQLFDEGALFSWSIHPNLIPYLFEDGSRRTSSNSRRVFCYKLGKGRILMDTRYFSPDQPFWFRLIDLTIPATGGKIYVERFQLLLDLIACHMQDSSFGSNFSLEIGVEEHILFSHEQNTTCLFHFHNIDNGEANIQYEYSDSFTMGNFCLEQWEFLGEVMDLALLNYCIFEIKFITDQNQCLCFDMMKKEMSINSLPNWEREGF